MDFVFELLKMIWFLLPAGVANMAAGVSGKLWPKFNFPPDFNYRFRGRRIFGDHKTIRGISFGTSMGFLIRLVQRYSIKLLKF
uniref:CDP-archaeol synthase n=1 Tax=candidate division WWE3 bacterium TaxID=2053526 RepID=A0A7C4TNY4_UNCKA